MKILGSPARGAVGRRLAEGLAAGTIPLSDYRLTSPFSQRGTKKNIDKASLWLKGGGLSLATNRWDRYDGT